MMSQFASGDDKKKEKDSLTFDAPPKNPLFFFLLFSLAFTACGDDDGGGTLQYTLCDDQILLDFDDHRNQIAQSLEQVPSALRSHISSEFPAFVLKEVYSYEATDGKAYLGAFMDNGGMLLFDSEGTFVCGDDSFSQNNKGWKDDDD